MSTSKRFGRLSRPLLKGTRSPDVAGKRRLAQKKAARFELEYGPDVAATAVKEPPPRPATRPNRRTRKSMALAKRKSIKAALTEEGI